MPQNCKYEILPQTQGLRLFSQRQLMSVFITFLPETLSAHTQTNKDMHTRMHKLSNLYTETERTPRSILHLFLHHKSSLFL